MIEVEKNSARLQQFLFYLNGVFSFVKQNLVSKSQIQEVYQVVILILVSTELTSPKLDFLEMRRRKSTILE